MRKTYRTIKNASKAKIYRRKLSIRSQIEGSSERPRICATKTNKNFFVQVIDDSAEQDSLVCSDFWQEWRKRHCKC